MRTYSVTLNGISPLLMARADIDIVDQRKPPLPKDATKEAKAERSAYRLPDGRLGLPTHALWSTTASGGKGMKILGKQKATVSSQLPSTMFMRDDDLTPLTTKAGAPITTYAINERLGRTKTNSLVVVTQPQIDDWAITFLCDIDNTEFHPTLIEKALSKAGKTVGIGAFRPERKGVYGRFEVVKFEEAS